MIALSRKKVIGIALVVVVALALAISLPLVLSSGALSGQTTGFPIKGHLVITDQNGNVLVDKDNIIVNTGYSAISYYIGSATSTTFNDSSSGYAYDMNSFNVIGVGDGTSAPAVGYADLQGMQQARQPGTFTNLGVGKWKIERAFTYGDMTGGSVSSYTGDGVLEVQEAGVFSSPVIGFPGAMLCMQTFSLISVELADTLTVTWYFTVTTAVL